MTDRNKKKAAGLSIGTICQLAVMGCVIFVAKMGMAALPNIEPVSMMVILLAVVWGWKGLWSVYIYVFLAYCMWGMHWWNLYYLYVWLVLFAAAWLMRRNESRFVWACLGAVFGMLFGGLCALAQIVISGPAGALAWWISGIPFDLIHAGGNFLLILLLFQPLKRVMETIKHRFG